MTGTDRRVLLLLLVGATAAWMNLASLHESEHADSLLLVLVSTQRWTPFYWGQDRFGMLLPLLAMPVRSPVLNMVAQGFLSTAAVLLAPFLVARFLSRDHWFAIGALTNVALLLVASREVQFDWFCNQPYGLAMTLGFGGLVVLEDVQRPAARIVAALLVVLAHWVHVGVFVVLVPAILLRRPSMIRGLVLVVVGAIAVVLLARLAAALHTPAAVT